MRLYGHGVPAVASFWAGAHGDVEKLPSVS